MLAQALTTSALGYGLSATYCTALLPYPSTSLTPTLVAISTIQPTLGLGTSTTTGKILPDMVAGRQKLAEDIVRRVSTARGTLPDTKSPTTLGNFGIDVTDYVDADMTTGDCGRLAAAIDAQCRQDERVVNSVTTVTLSGSTLTIVIILFDGAGPFKLTLTIDVLLGNLQLLGST